MEESRIECIGEAKYMGINIGNNKYVSARLVLEFNQKLNCWVLKLWCGNYQQPRINYDLRNPRKMLNLPKTFLKHIKKDGMLTIPFRNGTTVHFRQESRSKNLQILGNVLQFLQTHQKRITIYSKQNTRLLCLLNGNNYEDSHNTSADFSPNSNRNSRRYSHQRTNSYRTSNDSWTRNHQYNSPGKCDSRHESVNSTMNNSFSNGKANLRRSVLQETSNVTPHPTSVNTRSFYKENSDRRDYSYRKTSNYHSPNHSHNHPRSQEPRFYSPTRSQSQTSHHRWHSDFNERLESSPYENGNGNHTPRRSPWHNSFSYSSDSSWSGKRGNSFKPSSPASQKSNGSSCSYESQKLGIQKNDYNNSSVQCRTRNSSNNGNHLPESELSKINGNSDSPLIECPSKSQSSSIHISHSNINFYGKTINQQRVVYSPDTFNNSSQDRATFRNEKSPVSTSRKRSLSSTEVSPKRPRSIVLCTSENKENRNYASLGFKNLGNTCYMNVVLQILLAADSFIAEVRHILQQRCRYLLNKETLLRFLYELYLQRQETFYGNHQHLRNSEDKKNGLLLNIKKAASEVNENFRGNEMQDAQEFLICILQILKEEIDEVNKLPISNGSQDEPVANPSNPICENFGFKIKETLVCKQCSNTVDQQQDYYDLPINLPENRNKYSIQSMLDDYFKPDSRDYVCQSKDCDHKQSIASSELLQLPRILIIQLKRVVYNSHVSKNNRPVKIPVYITVKECSHSDVEDPPSISNDVWHSLAGGDMLSNGMFHSVQRRLFPVETSSCSNEDRMNGSEDSLKLYSTFSLEEQKNEGSISDIEEKENLLQKNLKSCDGRRCMPLDHQLNRNGLSTPGIGLRGGYPQQENISMETDEPLHASMSDPHLLKSDGIFMPEEGIEDVFAEIPTSQEEEAEHLKAAMEKSLEQNEDNDLIQAKQMSLLDLESQNGDNWETEFHDENLEDNSEMDSNQDGSQPHSYRLIGVISHNGNSSSGHYIAEVFRFQEKKWFTFNDDKITEITEQQVCEKSRSNGYLFFYLHKNIYDDLSKRIYSRSSCG